MAIEETAALCVARLFQGWGHVIRKEGGGTVYAAEGADKLTAFEKETLKEAYFFFIDLMEGKVKRDDIKAPQGEHIRGYRND